MSESVLNLESGSCAAHVLQHVVYAYVEVHLELLTIHAFHSYLSSSNQRLVVRGHR